MKKFGFIVGILLSLGVASAQNASNRSPTVDEILQTPDLTWSFRQPILLLVANSLITLGNAREWWTAERIRLQNDVKKFEKRGKRAQRARDRSWFQRQKHTLDSSIAAIDMRLDQIEQIEILAIAMEKCTSPQLFLENLKRLILLADSHQAFQIGHSLRQFVFKPYKICAPTVTEATQ